METTIITPPATEPITLAQAKAYIRTTTTVEDQTDLITHLISAARKQVEEDTGRAIGTQVWKQSQGYWPHSRYRTLYACPVQAITTVTYTTATATAVLPSDTYRLVARENTFSSIQLKAGAKWPDEILLHPGLEITFTCGYTTVPQKLIEAMAALITYWYDNPEAAVASTEYKAEVGVLPLRYNDLIANYKLWGN